MTLYTICHDEGDDFSLWRDDYTYVAPLFRTKTEAFNYIKKAFPLQKCTYDVPCIHNAL